MENGWYICCGVRDYNDFKVCVFELDLMWEDEGTRGGTRWRFSSPGHCLFVFSGSEETKREVQTDFVSKTTKVMVRMAPSHRGAPGDCTSHCARSFLKGLFSSPAHMQSKLFFFHNPGHELRICLDLISAGSAISLLCGLLVHWTVFKR